MNPEISQDLWKARGEALAAPVPPAIDGLRVIKLLGTGGYGAVWLCEQSEPLKRLVAVKVIRSVAAGPRLRSRFEAERRVLARMDHPGVAQVFEAGESSDGSLYFIMELVEGEPIAEWCDRHSLPIEVRLGLMRQVAAAVQHAHSKAIIHLDLKSSNILVREVDGHPVVKVIDFGIARLVGDEDSIATQAMVGGREAIGTLEFIAPEQLSGAQHLDTRADVYSLGVVLHHLLTGLLPFDAQRLQASGTVEAQRIIRECDAQPPSLRVRQANSAEPAEARERSRARGLSPKSLERMLRGQLDLVILHCLEKSPELRYATCDALSEDIRRWVDHEPVLAKTASRSLRLRKFARRNRGVLGVAAILFVGMAVSLGVIWQFYSDARLQLARVERHRDFNKAMLESVAPDVAQGMDTKLMLMILNQAATTIESQYRDDPELAADANETVGCTYNAIGESELALLHLRRKLAALSSLYGDDDLRVLESKNDVGYALLNAGQVDEAAPLIEDVLAQRRELLGESDRATLASIHNLGYLREKQNKLKEALALYEDAALRKRAALGPDDDSTLQSANSAAVIYRTLRDFPAARAIAEEVVARRIATFGEDHSSSLLARNNYCEILRCIGPPEAVEPAFNELVVDMERVFGSDHSLTLVAKNNLAAILRETSRLAEAEALYRLVIAGFEAKMGSQHAYTLSALGNLALTLDLAHNYAAAEPIYIDVIARKRAKSRPGHGISHSTLASIMNLGRMYLDLDRHQEAKPLLVEARTGFVASGGPSAPLSIQAGLLLARNLYALDEREEALALAQGVLADAIAGNTEKQINEIARLIDSIERDRAPVAAVEPQGESGSNPK